MPTLAFSDDFGPDERRIYTKTFAHACRELDITNVDATVMLLKEPYANRSTKGCILRLARDCYRVAINSHNDDLDGTFALCHETVHIKQFVRGEMGDHPAGVTWKGRLYPTAVALSKAFYLNLPWEKEAHGLTPAIHDRALRCLNYEEVAKMIDVACEKQAA